MWWLAIFLLVLVAGVIKHYLDFIKINAVLNLVSRDLYTLVKGKDFPKPKVEDPSCTTRKYYIYETRKDEHYDILTELIFYMEEGLIVTVSSEQGRKEYPIKSCLVSNDFISKRLEDIVDGVWGAVMCEKERKRKKEA